MVVYDDGTTESLDSALESRTDAKKGNKESVKSSAIENPQLTNGLFSFVRKIGNERQFCFTKIDPVSLISYDKSLKTIKLDRSAQNVKLMGYTVIPGKSANSDPSLITIWSDKRFFKAFLSTSEASPTIGHLHSIIDSINANNKLSITPINQDCVAIYASTQNDDGSFVILYNIKYKIIQSKVPFKVYLSNFKLWSVHKSIFLAMGEQLSVIPYRISADKLTNMVGSQCDSEIRTFVEKEMINEDGQYEDNLEFDDDQSSVEGMEMEWQDEPKKKFIMSKAPPIVSADEVEDQLNQMYREELVVDIVRDDNLPEGMIQSKLLSNVDETFPMLSLNFEILCEDLEKYGCSEIEITNKVIPVLIKTNRTEDIGLLLKRYNHVSEQMLTKIIKYLLSCKHFDEEEMTIDEETTNDADFDKSKLCKDKKFKNVNAFLSTAQSEHRDVLSIVLCSSFDSKTILKFLHKEITLVEMVTLMDHLYKILTTSSLNDPYDMRGNLVEGNDFDLDTKLFEWFQLLLDSHYQQILLSHDGELQRKLESWLRLVDNHIRILTEMSEMRQILAKLAKGKPIHLSKQCNNWYSIEQLTLY